MSTDGGGPNGPGADRALSPTELKRLHRQWRRRTELRLALILDGVQKPFNVGSLIRSAAAYQVETIWAVPPCPPFDQAGVARTALGSDRFVQARQAESGPEAVEQARAEGFTVVAVELTGGAVPLHELAPTGPVALVLGHEDRGVHRRTLAAADHVAYLPQLGRIGSLNVAQAGTVALYEVARQAWTSPSPSPPAPGPT